MRDLKAKNQSKVKDNRLKKEQRPRDWRRLFHRLLMTTVLLGSAALAAGAAVLVGRLLFDSDYFRIATVRVENNGRLSAAEITDLSDIRIGSNIFELDLEMIGSKIEENPWIARARVDRIFPRDLVVRVAERQPAAIINLGYLYYLDAEGEVFKVLEAEDSLDFPVITGLDRRFLLDRPEAARRLLVTGLELLRQVAGGDQFTLAEVSELHIDPEGEYDLLTYVGGVPIRFGAADFDRKLQRLERIYPQLKPGLTGLRSIDLNVPDRVIVRVARSQSSGSG